MKKCNPFSDYEIKEAKTPQDSSVFKADLWLEMADKYPELDPKEYINLQPERIIELYWAHYFK